MKKYCFISISHFLEFFRKIPHIHVELSRYFIESGAEFRENCQFLIQKVSTLIEILSMGCCAEFPLLKELAFLQKAI